MTRKLFLLALFIGALALAYGLDLQRYLSFEALAENQTLLHEAVREAPLLSALIYMALYIVVVAFSLPGATIMTLSGGLLFGIIWGGALTIIAATLGAALLFLAARYLVGDYLRARGGATLQKFEAAFNRDAASYLLVLRLLPIFPFFIVNLGAALVGVRFVTFFWTTLLGIIPGTMVYISIGNGIASVLAEGRRPDLAIITKPEIILPLIALALLSLLPVIWKRVSKNNGKN